MILEQLPELQRLSPWEKLILVSELWDDLQQNPQDVPVSQEIFDELDRRFAEYEAHPEQITSWIDAKRRIRASRRS